MTQVQFKFDVGDTVQVVRWREGHAPASWEARMRAKADHIFFGGG